jgi:DNA-binding transcriptional regulator/RsmH inhibitor MraZ
MGNSGGNGLVRLFGFRESLSLDARGRFRLPDNLSAMLHRELGRLQRSVASDAPPAAFERLSFYLVPGTLKRVFIYPIPNVHLAVERFENPPTGIDADTIRRARDYFYDRMSFIEADRQNRVVIPDALREHAGIDGSVEKIALVGRNYWLALSRADVAERRVAENLGAFEQAAPDLLDPVRRMPSPEDLPGEDRS